MPTVLSNHIAIRKSFLSVLDFEPGELEHCLSLAARLKRERASRRRVSERSLAGSVVAMLFEKPSLRTRTTFEIAIRKLGGDVVHLPSDVVFGAREPLSDVARNLERWVDAIVVRTSAHQRVVELATAAPRLHVINALTDEQHPCQALADFLTLQEHWGSMRHRTLAFIGDGNNVAVSLAHAGSMLGVTVNIASPEGYELPHSVISESGHRARHGAQVNLFRRPMDAVIGAQAIYTDVWASMGRESEARLRRQRFAPYQVNRELMAAAEPGALFMHCLPAHRGEEVTGDVLGGSQSVVLDQAENRLYTAEALLLMLLAGSGDE